MIFRKPGSTASVRRNTACMSRGFMKPCSNRCAATRYEEEISRSVWTAAKTLGMSTVRLKSSWWWKRGVTADTALRSAQLFKTTPQFWMHMQANFDLKAAMVRRRTLKLAKRT